ncbi:MULTISPECIES: PAAR domain-containing protein [Bosea]|uniref:PAAR domain-containing protein n=1 Tax=Bosea TaxID=85413 RepID=UPI00214FE52B|nr:MULTISPECIES: PAAR domain-containing protein [Bosea]MCR4520883.1 PAAR domain-containing protein [Bosea sp. 47.2.35]MDR6827573.1 putative Zn-binding protein involved in type VI secretion [Bosea robiniae]MDR6894283.1 putative Zn-binding protein involved in type VI secretion [Bosea sp. BE109]MDR7137679.1 putative Zn-binding protein involved in type VI secretion [Bosea sp. BE168]MDR7174378.1 putative Zn-binding protein involved in type VI secretion [Bosea sp. BE271]
MPKGPAARIMDPVLHPLPPVLQPGPGSMNVIIGGMLAWRGVPAAAAAAIQAAKAVSDAALQVAQAATVAAAGTPGAPAAIAAEETAKNTAAASMGSMITGAAGGADIHICLTPLGPLPLPTHGPGVVIDGSQTVLINNLPACRMGDTVLEALGPPNKIAMGLPTVIIGG